MISTGGEGLVSKRKRVRGKIGNPSHAPELKQYNLLDDTQAVNAFYRWLFIYGVYSNELNVRSLWHPILFRWPPLGPAAGARVGRRIRVKYLRLKGFVAASPFLINQVRYRIVLYRVRVHEVDGHEVYDQAWLESLYQNYINFDSEDIAGNASLLQDAAVRNYYQSYFDTEELGRQDCKRRILLKGLLKPNADIGNFSVSSEDTGTARVVPSTLSNTDAFTGQSIGTGTITRAAVYGIVGNDQPWLVGEFQRHFTNSTQYVPANMKSFFPIDLTVVMNDNIDTWEYRYVCVVESDWVIGQSPSGVYGSTTSNSNFIFSIIPQIYYTDD